MAEILAAQQLLAQSFEPKRDYRWIIEIDGMDTFLAQTAGRPKVSVEESEHNFINSVQYFAGKARPEPLDISFIDAIAPSQAQKAFEWMRLIYEFETGLAHGKDVYGKTMMLKMLGPEGEVVEKWRLENAWPTNYDPSDLDYNSSEFSTVNLSLRFDRPIQLY